MALDSNLNVTVQVADETAAGIAAVESSVGKLAESVQGSFQGLQNSLSTVAQGTTSLNSAFTGLAGTATATARSFTGAFDPLKASIDNVDKAVGTFQTNMARLPGTLGALAAIVPVAGAVSASIGFISSAVEKASNAQQTYTQTLNSWKAMARGSEDSLKALSAEVSILSSTSSVSTGAMNQALQTLMQYSGVSNSQLIPALKVAQDMSAATGKSVGEAAQLIGFAAMGMGARLKRYGIELSDAAIKSKDMGVILKELGQRFAGQDAAKINTYAGSMALLSKNIGSMQANIGKIFTAALTPVIKDMAAFAEGLRTQVSSAFEAGDFSNFTKSMQGMFQQVAEGSKRMTEGVFNFLKTADVTAIAQKFFDLASAIQAIASGLLYMVGMLLQVPSWAVKAGAAFLVFKAVSSLLSSVAASLAQAAVAAVGVYQRATAGSAAYLGAIRAEIAALTTRNAVLQQGGAIASAAATQQSAATARQAGGGGFAPAGGGGGVGRALTAVAGGFAGYEAGKYAQKELDPKQESVVGKFAPEIVGVVVASVLPALAGKVAQGLSTALKGGIGDAVKNISLRGATTGGVAGALPSVGGAARASTGAVEAAGGVGGVMSSLGSVISNLASNLLRLHPAITAFATAAAAIGGAVVLFKKYVSDPAKQRNATADEEAARTRSGMIGNVEQAKDSAYSKMRGLGEMSKSMGDSFGSDSRALEAAIEVAKAWGEAKLSLEEFEKTFASVTGFKAKGPITGVFKQYQEEAAAAAKDPNAHFLEQSVKDLVNEMEYQAIACRKPLKAIRKELRDVMSQGLDKTALADLDKRLDEAVGRTEASLKKFHADLQKIGTDAAAITIPEARPDARQTLQTDDQAGDAALAATRRKVIEGERATVEERKALYRTYVEEAKRLEDELRKAKTDNEKLVQDMKLKTMDAYKANILQMESAQNSLDQGRGFAAEAAKLYDEGNLKAAKEALDASKAAFSAAKTTVQGLVQNLDAMKRASQDLKEQNMETWMRNSMRFAPEADKRSSQYGMSTYYTQQAQEAQKKGDLDTAAKYAEKAQALVEASMPSLSFSLDDVIKNQRGVMTPEQRRETDTVGSEYQQKMMDMNAVMGLREQISKQQESRVAEQNAKALQIADEAAAAESAAIAASLDAVNKNTEALVASTEQELQLNEHMQNTAASMTQAMEKLSSMPDPAAGWERWLQAAEAVGDAGDKLLAGATASAGGQTATKEGSVAGGAKVDADTGQYSQAKNQAVIEAAIAASKLGDGYQESKDSAGKESDSLRDANKETVDAIKNMREPRFDININADTGSSSVTRR